MDCGGCAKPRFSCILQTIDMNGSPGTSQRKGIALLTGAGFTKNFGGFLASEMWAAILNYPPLRNTILRQRMLATESLNFEEIYDGVQEDPTLPAELKRIFADAILFSFEEMHRAWPDSLINKPSKFLIFFFRRILQLAAGEPVFCFTLNQDLFLERHWPAKSHLPPLELPLLELPDVFFDPPERTAGLQWKLPDIETVALKRGSYQPLDGQVHYVKLHGSLEWKDRKNEDRLVIGTRKTEAIRDEPLLNWYFEHLFPSVLDHVQNLVVIGYGFRDEHINKQISHAIEKGLGIVMLTPDPPDKFREAMVGPVSPVLYGESIWNGLRQYECAELADFYRKRNLTGRAKVFLERAFE